MSNIKPTLFAIKRSGGSSGVTELHALSGLDNFNRFIMHNATGLHTTGSNWFFTVSDTDRDLTTDLVAINRSGASGSTEVHVLSGESNYQKSIVHKATGLHPTGQEWDFFIADWTGSGIDDLIAINRNGGSGRTEVHVLSGESNYQTFVAHISTGLHSTSNDWTFKISDWTGSGKLDLVCINRKGSSGKTEIHVLSGDSGLKDYIFHGATGLHQTDLGWSFSVADWGLSGKLDLIAIKHRGGSGKVEVHVLSANSDFKNFSAHIVTGLHAVDDEWTLLLPEEAIRLEIERDDLQNSNISTSLLSEPWLGRTFRDDENQDAASMSALPEQSIKQIRSFYTSMHLNSKERRFVVSHPIDSFRAASSARDAIERVRDEYPRHSLLNGRGDAVRHCYWSAKMHRDLGATTASTILNNHEHGRNDPHDEHNNEKGAEVADSAGSNATDDRLFDDCRIKERAGGLSHD